MVKFYDSFSYLLGQIKRGEFPGDAPNHLYHFGCTGTLEGVMDTVRSYEFPEDKIAGVLEMLAFAAQDGRVSWRMSQTLGKSEQSRFRSTLRKAREMGAEIPDWDQHSKHYDAYWNIPAMRRFLGNSVTYANRI